MKKKPNVVGKHLEGLPSRREASVGAGQAGRGTVSGRGGGL